MNKLLFTLSVWLPISYMVTITTMPIAQAHMSEKTAKNTSQWVWVNENDPSDEFKLFVDFENVIKQDNARYQINMKTSTLPSHYTAIYPMPLYQPYMTSQQTIDCQAQTITTYNRKLFAKIEPTADFIDVYATFKTDADASSPSDERTNRSLSMSDVVDKQLFSRLCQSNPQPSKQK
ncbi:hypothetical protein [Psychrobacter sp. I-STPA10]|uniref:hypothetical protein n=1 Tax=Psychrobacter sp. I-STPA10 TaxID=2585769 RepID=UPI001E54DE39|nr:hypothetical protein [Psychrobacter sp. I-STPA10]